MGKLPDNSSLDMSYNSNSTAEIISATDTSSSKDSSGSYCSCFHSIKLFTAVVGILSLINGAIAASYLPAVLTTIEQRFQLESSKSGLIVSSYEIGATIAVLFVSYLGHHGHIPRIIAIGTLIIGVGSLLFSVPHWISPNYTENIVLGQGGVNFSFASCNVNPNWGMPHSDECSGRKTLSGNTRYIAIFIVAQIIIGVGSSPIMTIALTFIDNSVNRKVSAQYVGVVYAASILGAVVGYGGGSGTAQIYVDFFTHSAKSLSLTSEDNLWIGAWWGGFIIFAISMCFIAPWLFMFPKSLNQPSEEVNKVRFDLGDSKSTINDVTNGGGDDATVKPSANLAPAKLSDLPKATLHLLKNPVYMLINFGSVFIMLIVTGFTTFAAKYLENQFFVSRSQASLLTGAVAIPPAVVGILFMGFLIKRFKMGLIGVIKSVILLNIIATCCTGAAMFLGCDTLDVAGVNKTDQEWTRKSINWVENCDSDCNCNPIAYKPVCVDKRITYPSRCHLGCFPNSVDGEAGQCSCSISDQFTSDVPAAYNVSSVLGSVTAGSCKASCTLLPAFLVLLIIVSFALAASKTPIAIITLRCVSEDLKSFGLGIQIMVIRLLALLPAPIIYGAVIDDSCLWRKEECGDKLNCLVYSNTEFRYKFFGLSVGFNVIATILFIIAWLLLRRDANNNTDERATEINDVSENVVYITHL